MAATIDAHQHFWQISWPFNYSWLDAPPNAPIKRDFLPEHLEPLIRPVNVGHTVFVQTQHNLEETRWALGLAERHPFIAGVVGWVDLAGDRCEEQLLGFKGHPRFVGVRHITRTSRTTISSCARTSSVACACWRSTACRSTCCSASSTCGTCRRWRGGCRRCGW